MTPTSPTLPALALRPSDLRGLTRLGVDGTVGLTDLVEAMHHTIVSGMGIAAKSSAGRTSGITGFVYGAVRGTTRVLGKGVDAALRAIEATASANAGSPERDALIAALNGLFGDHLADSNNPLAIRMALRCDGVALDLNGDALAARLPAATGKILVLAHGLCMNDRQWTRNSHDHGQALARSQGFTPVYLHYNSGRHVWQNGREFADMVQQLLARWPVPLEELVIVGHSMGGLVARSACHHAAVEGQPWLRSLSKLVCLGTPHHGAPLERGGRWIDVLLGLSPYAAPFARLGKTRSAGITDLRFGNVQDAAGSGRDRHAQHRDDRPPTPLPPGVQTWLLAATLSASPGRVHSTMIGDGLVPVPSALGEHRDAALALDVPPSHRHIVADCGHLDLLCHADVSQHLQQWLATPADQRR